MAGAAKVKRGAIGVGGPKETPKQAPEQAPEQDTPETTRAVVLEIDHNFVVKTVHADIIVMCTSAGLAIKAIDRTLETGGKISFGKDTK